MRISPTIRYSKGYLASAETPVMVAALYAEDTKLSKSHINVQYRRLHRFFNWLVEWHYVDSNPLYLIRFNTKIGRRNIIPYNTRPPDAVRNLRLAFS